MCRTDGTSGATPTVATEIRHGAHAAERLVRHLPVSPPNVDEVRAVLRLAYAARALLAEMDDLLCHWLRYDGRGRYRAGYEEGRCAGAAALASHTRQPLLDVSAEFLDVSLIGRTINLV
jgi:hypothetical protein